MRRVRGAGRVIDEERLARVDLVDAVQVVDGVVGHAGDQVPARLALERIDLGRVAEEVRLPLVGVAADEAVEILEAHAGRPLVERPDLAGREGRRVVVLAEPGGGVAVVLEDAADGGLVLGDDAVVAGEAGGLLRDHAEAGRVMVAPGDQRGARRRAERGGVNVVVAQPVFAMRSIVGVGMTPPKVLGTPKPASSVMMSRTLGAPLGGTTRGAHQGFDCRASP